MTPKSKSFFQPNKKSGKVWKSSPEMPLDGFFWKNFPDSGLETVQISEMKSDILSIL